MFKNVAMPLCVAREKEKLLSLVTDESKFIIMSNIVKNPPSDDADEDVISRYDTAVIYVREHDNALNRLSEIEASYGLLPMSDEELQDEYIASQIRSEQEAATGYIAKRLESYPPIGDQLDAIWKALATIEILPEPTQEVLNKIIQVKEDNPKPPKS